MIRWRPRFSVRTLTIGVTLICIYFGTWQLTKSFGVLQSEPLLRDYEAAHGLLDAAITSPAESSPAPFVVRRTVYGYMNASDEYYLWLFGPRIELGSGAH